MQPGAKRSEIAGLHSGRLKVRLTARAVDGAANKALVQFLAESLDARKQDIRIESGKTSRQKRVSVLGARRAPENLLSA